jgi:hypothetical protein
MLPGHEVDAAARGDHAVISVIVHDLLPIDMKLLPSSGASEKLWVPPTDRLRKPSNSRVTSSSRRSVRFWVVSSMRGAGRRNRDARKVMSSRTGASGNRWARTSRRVSQALMVEETHKLPFHTVSPLPRIGRPFI